MVIIPAGICFSTTVLIYRHLQLPIDRVQTGAAATTTGPRRISRRDISLLRHSVVMFGIFIIGWAPRIINNMIEYFGPVNTLTDRILEVLFQLAVLVDIMDLFLYNHKVRRYLIGFFQPLRRNQRESAANVRVT